MPSIAETRIMPHLAPERSTAPALDNSLIGRCKAYATPIIESVKAMTYMCQGKLFTQIIDAISRGATATSGKAHCINEFVKKLPYLKVFGGVILPVAAYYIGKDCQKLSNANNNDEEIDASLSLATNSSWFGDAMANFVSGMQLFGWVGTHATAFVSGCLGFSAILAPATILQAIRATNTSHQALEILKKTPETLNREQHNHKSYRIVKSALNITAACMRSKDENWLDRMLYGLTHFGSTGSGEGLTAVNNHLKWRITLNKVSIVSAILLTLGTILFLFSPLLLPAYGLLAASAILTAVTLGGEAYSCRKLCHKLESLSAEEHWPLPPEGA